MTKYTFDIETYAENESDVQILKWNGISRQNEIQYVPNPIKERIICIVLQNLDTKSFSYCMGTEKEVLELFWNFVNTGDELYGFNSSTFDSVYINVRSFINNVKTKKIFTYDLRNILFIGNMSFKGKLSDFANILGIQVNTSNGSTVRNLFIANELYKIQEHCKEDVIITTALYERLKYCDLLL